MVVPFSYSEGISEGIEKLLALAQVKGTSEGITDSLKASLVEIIAIILKEKRIRASEIAEKLKKPYKTVERHIKTLKEIGAVEYEGANKTGGYIVSAKLRRTLEKHWKRQKGS